MPADQELLEIPFFHNCIMGMDSVAEKMGYNILLVSLESHDISPLERVLTQQKVDGVILLRTLVKDYTVEYLLSKHIPFLTVGQSNYASVQYVDSDIIRACKDMMAYLTTQKKMHRIALIGGDANHTITQKRIMGFREGLLLHNRKILDHLIYLNCSTKDKVYQAAEELVEKCAECIVCMDDSICSSVLNKLKKEGVSVPGQIKVASFFDSMILENHTPSITSLSYNVKELGMVTCRTLMDIIEEKEVAEVTLLGYEVVLKESTK